jgi:hypothetical protein
VLCKQCCVKTERLSSANAEKPFLFFRRPNWPTYRFYDIPYGPLGISFFIATSASGVSGTTGSFAAAVLPLEPPLPPDPKKCIAVSASPSIAPPFPPPQVREAMEKPNQRVYGGRVTVD